MFNAYRSFPRPSDLESGNYNTPEVFSRLSEMFHSKCYLCESSELSSPEIEHLNHHKGDKLLMRDWSNLFYSCDRCNSLKSSKYEIISCCDTQANVARLFMHILPSIPGLAINITATENNDFHKVQNTAKLLDHCFNDESTANRKATKTNLVENIYRHYCLFITQRTLLFSSLATVAQKRDAKEQLLEMIDVKYPYSIFWRWHAYIDKDLCAKIGISEEIFAI